MSLIRTIINSTYPLRMMFSRLTGKGITIIENKNSIKTPISFYSLSATLNSGEIISFEKYKGKKVLIVNLASECGYTQQYAELERMYQQNKGIEIIGFPANNFGEQEPGTDEEIASFCKLNFGVTFPLFKKDEVKGNSKQPIYDWLTDKNKNGWNELEPQWNFYKYLIDENGNLAKIFSSAVTPPMISNLK